MQVSAFNVPRAYEAALYQLKIYAEKEDSRLGPVYTVQEPVHLTIQYPVERVLFDSTRNANPFFHLMETIWMLAGRHDVQWLLNFNSRYANYANEGIVHGAYGYRWLCHFGRNQVLEVAEMLKKDPTTRRAVIGMWDPASDLRRHRGYNDYPCNTHIYFRVVDSSLDMTVCNRSNDFFWGMMGANCVHMTILQEIVARYAGFGVGKYHVLTNNLHVYENMPDFEKLWNSVPEKDLYSHYPSLLSYPIVVDSLTEFLADCALFLVSPEQTKHPWLREVCYPMLLAYTERKLRMGDGLIHIDKMPNCDWKKAAQLWIQRKISSSLTSTELSPSTNTEPTSSKRMNPNDGTSTSTSVEEMQ